MGEKIFARQLGNVNTWTILKEMMKMILMRMRCIIMTEIEPEFSCLFEFVCFVAEDRRTDEQMEEQWDGRTDVQMEGRTEDQAQ